MPIYEYRCRSCGKEFERLVRFAENAGQVVCPACRSEAVEKKPSAFGRMGSLPGSASSPPRSFG